jgi:hypothetical protein
VKYLTWTDDNLLWQVVYEGMREDKPAAKSGGRGRIPRATRADSRTATSKNA